MRPFILWAAAALVAAALSSPAAWAQPEAPLPLDYPAPPPPDPAAPVPDLAPAAPVPDPDPDPDPAAPVPDPDHSTTEPPRPPKTPERSALSFGVAVGIRSIDQGAYWGSAPEFLDRMGAEVDAPQDAFALSLSQQLRLSQGFAVVFRQRYWAASMKGEFALAPALDWSLNREVLALGASPAFISSDGMTEFSAGVGPTAYLLRSEQKGHLGDDDTSSLGVGVDAWVSVFFGLADDGASVGAVFVRDWYPLDRVNPLVRDGGEAGGWSAMLGARWR